MVEEKSEDTPPIITEEKSHGNSWTTFVILLVIPFVVANSIFYYCYNLLQRALTHPNVSFINSSSGVDELQRRETSTSVLSTRITPIVSQPNSSKLQYVMNEIQTVVELLKISKQMCRPEDFDKQKEVAETTESSADPRGYVVIYIAVALLVTSLVAALWDVYRVKGNTKNKPQMTKKCLLADLTVMRHSRRESMKRDEMDDRRPSLKLLGRKVSMSRPPLNLN